jgi:hypothetical protein
MALEYTLPCEFVSLIRATVGQPVSLSEFNLAVRRVIKEVMLTRQIGKS